MSNRQNFSYRPIATIFIGCALFCAVLISCCFEAANSYPTKGLNTFSSHETEFGHKEPPKSETAETSFQQFIHSSPDSVVIAEIKPNSSEQEMTAIRNKIAKTILGMQEMDKASTNQSPEPASADCFVEVTRVERVPGKCHKVGGLSTCQSDEYIAIDPDCN